MKPRIDNAARFLQERGLLFEINRTILHPLGLALSVVAEGDGTISGFGPIFDHSDDPEGVVFSDEDLASGMERVAKTLEGYEADRRSAARMERIGCVVQGGDAAFSVLAKAKQ